MSGLLRQRVIAMTGALLLCGAGASSGAAAQTGGGTAQTMRDYVPDDALSPHYDLYGFDGKDVPHDAQWIDNLLNLDLSGIRLSPKQRADLSSCDGATPVAIVRAAQTCQPVLELYRRANRMMYDFENIHGADAPYHNQHGIFRLAYDARIVLRITAERDYPAYDIPALIAHMALGLIAVDPSTTDLDAARYHADAIDTIIATSRIDDPDFRRISAQISAHMQSRMKIALNRPKNRAEAEEAPPAKAVPMSVD